MTLHNIMETIVLQLFEEFREKYHLKCRCNECKMDILAITLNQVPPRYVSTTKGEVMMKVQFTETQMKHDIIREITLAALKVEKNPRH